MALERVDGPILGPRRDDLRSGVIAATIANVNRRQGTEPVSPEEFALRFARPLRPDEVEPTAAAAGHVLDRAAKAAEEKSEKPSRAPAREGSSS